MKDRSLSLVLEIEKFWILHGTLGARFRFVDYTTTENDPSHRTSGYFDKLLVQLEQDTREGIK